MQPTATVAYLSMEVGLDTRIPTYSGGLGVLAGDTLRAAADLGVPMVAMTMLYHQGYFRQELDASGTQSESPVEWNPADQLNREDTRITVTIEGRQVHVGVWRYDIEGVTGHVVPVYFLDTNHSENDDWDRELTHRLYGGELRYRLAQEIVLGIGGTRMLAALGFDGLETYHMNEGHSALLTLALLARKLGDRGLDEATVEDKRAVREQCVFTTHTPVPAGHDKFPLSLVLEMLGEKPLAALKNTQSCVNDELNMTYLALDFSRYINGVAMKHGAVSRSMFPQYPVNAITNGVHAATWAADSMAALFDTHMPEWRQDSLYLRYAINLPLGDVQTAHRTSKLALLGAVKERSDVSLDPDALTIGFARRATPYKRADMLFRDIDRLARIATEVGPIQVLYAGKAHPRDEGGKDLIRRIHEASRELKDRVTVVYVEGYDMELGRLLTSGVDVWLNTPRKPHEASGTSGMKAALNGVPSLSVLDGWWIEGHVEGVTGWSIGESAEAENDEDLEAAALYTKLRRDILPLFYGHPEKFAAIRRFSIALNASFFNTQRMVAQYVRNAYRR